MNHRPCASCSPARCSPVACSSDDQPVAPTAAPARAEAAGARPAAPAGPPAGDPARTAEGPGDSGGTAGGAGGGQGRRRGSQFETGTPGPQPQAVRRDPQLRDPLQRAPPAPRPASTRRPRPRATKYQAVATCSKAGCAEDDINCRCNRECLEPGDCVRAGRRMPRGGAKTTPSATSCVIRRRRGRRRPLNLFPRRCLICAASDVAARRALRRGPVRPAPARGRHGGIRCAVWPL